MGFTSKYYDQEMLNDKVAEKSIKFFIDLKMIDKAEQVKAVLSRMNLGTLGEGIIVTDKQVAFFTQNTSTKMNKMSYPLQSITGVSVINNYIHINIGGGNDIEIPLVAAVSEINKLCNLILDLIPKKEILQNVSSVSSADEVVKFKQLLDMGVITQEEFEQKKKQLLGSANQNGKDYTPNTENNSSQAVNKPKKKKKGCLITCIIIFGLFGFGLIFGINQMLKNPERYNSKEEIFDKEAAKKLDEEVWDKVIYTIVVNNYLVHEMDAYSELKIKAVDFYDSCGVAYNNLGNKYNSYPKNKNEYAKAYIQTCKTYTLYVQTFAQSLRDYIDSGKVKDLSKVKENIESIKKGLDTVTNNRVVFLKEMGFTEDEITELANKIDTQIEEKEKEVIK